MSKVNPESKVVADMRKAVSRRWCGVAALYRSQAGSGFPSKKSPSRIEFLPVGWPDTTLLIRGRIMGVEAKTKTGRPEESQLKMARNWRLWGVPYVFPRSVDELMEAIETEFPPEVWADPTAEERDRFRQAMAQKDDPRAWLTAEGFL
ncbi:hypothetical protein [Sagittula sp. MA-2]|uniref:hypothetical protein n=1 Tax=Sagittula sp. MA-2 TaxID=3048007 RepID=UPI0024C33A9A|nr:hypothetical protein [Sagittula sp. MA-2]WHZ36529.1 hypothetical protein QNI11_05825 [Sagittula sp. MA-2]